MKVWLRRSKEYGLYVFYVGESKSHFGALIADIWEHVRPDLKLEPGEGPVEVRRLNPTSELAECQTCLQEADETIATLESQRDALLAAAKMAYGKLNALHGTWAKMGADELSAVIAACEVAACEEKA